MTFVWDYITQTAILLQRLAEVVRKFRAVAVGIRRSTLKAQELTNYSDRKLSLDVVTRWNSTLEMLKRVDESRFGIDALGYTKKEQDSAEKDAKASSKQEKVPTPLDEEFWMGQDPTEPTPDIAKKPELPSHYDWDTIANLIPVLRYGLPDFDLESFRVLTSMKL
jgi:hypothetical protein